MTAISNSMHAPVADRAPDRAQYRPPIDRIGSHAPVARAQSAGLRIAFVGNSLPRRCGIATFTTDLQSAVAGQDDVADSAIIAMCDAAGDYHWPRTVRRTIAQDSRDDIARQAMGRKAYAASRPTVWSQTAERYVACLRSACRRQRLPLFGATAA